MAAAVKVLRRARSMALRLMRSYAPIPSTESTAQVGSRLQACGPLRVAPSPGLRVGKAGGNSAE